MRSFRISVLLVAILSPAGAQVGPTEARPIMGQLGAVPRAVTRVYKDRSTEVELVVGSDGFVKAVDVLDSSGDAGFDASVQSYFKKWRMVPAIDDAGRPYESRMQIRYGAERTRVVAPRRPPAQPDEMQKKMVIQDSERVPRMTCKDFLWEYDIVTSTKRASTAQRDPLLHTPLVLFVMEAKPSESQVKQLNRRYDKLVRAVAEQCKGKPDSAFWTDTMKPALQASLAN